MEKKEIETELRMISAVTRALELRKIENDNEKILKEISVLVEKERKEGAKLGMIAAASRALDLAEIQPRMKDKEIIKKITGELFSIHKKVREE